VDEAHPGATPLKRRIKTLSNELLTRVEHGVAFITLNRPEKRNALTPDFLREFIAAVAAFEEDPAVRVLLLTGAGPDFSSGGEIKFLRTVQKMPQDEIRKNIYGAFLGAVKTFKLCSKPTVAAVNGGAVGAGCELAIAADFRVVGPKSFLHENWTAVGTIPPLGGMYLLPRLVGLERATNMIMRAQRVYGEEAIAIGLATKLAADGNVLETATELARDIAKRSPKALAWAKVGLRRGMEGTMAGEWDFNLLAQGTLVSGPDFAEWLDAIEAKREPVYV
jgi:enoyl-CoA hydratase/carnithine racemase